MIVGVVALVTNIRNWWGWILIAVGVFFLLNELVFGGLGNIWELWPVAVIVVGIVFIVNAIRGAQQDRSWSRRRGSDPAVPVWGRSGLWPRKLGQAGRNPRAPPRAGGPGHLQCHACGVCFVNEVQSRATRRATITAPARVRPQTMRRSRYPT